MDPNAVALCDLYADPNVLIPGKKDRVAYGAETRKLDQIGDDKRIDTLLLTSTVNETEAHFDIVKASKLVLFRGGTQWERPVVPIDPKQLVSRNLRLRYYIEFFNSNLGVQGEERTRLFRSGESNTALGKKVASINANRCTLHTPLAYYAPQKVVRAPAGALL
jgi:hypothetical protein